MYLAIDKERMCVTHRHPNVSVVHNITNIELAHSHLLVIDETSVLGNVLSIGELLLLYESITGQKGQTINREKLGVMVLHACLTLPITDAHAFEVFTQSQSIANTDDGYYRYKKGAGNPQPLAELYLPPALTGHASPLPIPPPMPTQQTPPSPHAPLAAALPAQRTPPKYPPPWA